MALYHSYRPQKFSDVIGQQHIIKTITNQIKQEKTAHAYLFSGPRGVGKTTSARLLAKALNCSERKADNEEPCDKCDSCKEISGSRSIDVIEIDAASHTGVDNVRENIIDNAHFKPTKSPFKIFIIDEVHMLSTSAFNALLKTLEEPPGHVIFVLATTEKHKLPETIISRCQVFNFKKVGYDDLKKYLADIAKKEGVKIEKEVVDRIINKSDGCVRDAISLLDQIMATGEKNITADVAELALPSSNVEETLEFVTKLVEKNMQAGLDLLNKLAEDGINFPQFSHDTVELLRVMMIKKANSKAVALGLDLSDKVRKSLDKLNKEISHPELISLIDLALKRKQEIKSAPLPQLPLEMVVVEWCSGHDAGHTQHDTKTNQQPTTSNEQSKNTSSKDTNNVTIPPLAGIPSEGGMKQCNNENDAKTKKIENKKKTLKEKVKNVVSKAKPVSQEEVKAKWKDFMKKIEADFPSLTFILKMADIVSVENNVIKIAVEFDFHRNKLSEKECQKKLENLLNEIFESKLKLDVIVAEVKKAKKENQELQELTNAFGGEVVN